MAGLAYIGKRGSGHSGRYKMWTPLCLQTAEGIILDFSNAVSDMASLVLYSLVALLASTCVHTQYSQSEFNGTCPDYVVYAAEHHGPYSAGAYNLSYQRPPLPCRTWNSTEVEGALTRMRGTIADADLYRLFENSFPNTLDTAIKWHGVASNNSEEELTFIITGDVSSSALNNICMGCGSWSESQAWTVSQSS
jgi:hypothetical protein